MFCFNSVVKHFESVKVLSKFLTVIINPYCYGTIFIFVRHFTSRVKKSYRCFCGKSYRSVQGLRNHTSLQHPSTDFTTATSQHVTLTHNLLSPSSAVSPSSVLSTKDSDQLSQHPSSLPVASRLATLTPSRLIAQKVAAQVKTVAVAASKGQGQAGTTLALPIGTSVRFISQPASVVPVPMAIQSVKLSSNVGWTVGSLGFRNVMSSL